MREIKASPIVNYDNPEYIISDERFDEIFEDLKNINSDMDELKDIVDKNDKDGIIRYMKNRLDLYQTRVIMSKMNVTALINRYQDEIFDLKTERNIFKTLSIMEGIILIILFMGHIF